MCTTPYLLLMASQWPIIHFTTWVDMPQQVSQSLVRDADYSLKWIAATKCALKDPGASFRTDPRTVAHRRLMSALPCLQQLTGGTDCRPLYPGCHSCQRNRRTTQGYLTSGTRKSSLTG
jgi:hypothetical protein